MNPLDRDSLAGAAMRREAGQEGFVAPLRFCPVTRGAFVKNQVHAFCKARKRRLEETEGAVELRRA